MRFCARGPITQRNVKQGCERIRPHPGATHFTFSPELSEVHERPVAIAVFTAALGLMAGLCPMFWGLFLKESSPHPGLVVPNFALYCAIAAGLSFASVALFARLPDHRAKTSG